jgi:uncharacterized protein (DUF433 family)
MNIDPEILGGEPCFNGTRVPLDTVVDNLAAGHSVEEILASYPSLSEEHIQAVLRWQLALVHQATDAESCVPRLRSWF